jgi:exonuclease III
MTSFRVNPLWNL